MLKKYILSTLLFLGIVAVVTAKGLPTEGPLTDTNYVKSIQTWHKARLESLKSENGWLNLAGLFWLKDGSNAFGTGKKNAVIFPKGKGGEKMGTFTLTNGEVWMEVDSTAQVTHAGKPVTRLKIFPAERNVVLASGSLRWFVIKRGPKIGIRLRDLEGATVRQFKDIDMFPIDEKWRVQAKFEPAVAGKTIDITDVLGQVTPQRSPGTLVFTIEGRDYRLDAVEEGDQYFIIFGDATNGKSTYGAGRFLYANKADASGNVTLDFNKSVNPPCAFTPYATCPLPPTQNKLAVAINAGEKNYGEH